MKRDEIVWSMLGALAAVFIVAIAFNIAWGQDFNGLRPHSGHAENHDWYKDLKQPGTNASCCNALTDMDPNGDCRPASVWRDAAGKVWARVDGASVPVPEDRVLPDALNKQPLTGHYCGRNGITYCALVGGAGG